MVGEMAEADSDSGVGNGCDFVHHKLAGSARSVAGAGFDGKAEQGAKVGSVVKGQRVMESSWRKRWSWRMSAGRGFPA